MSEEKTTSNSDCSNNNRDKASLSSDFSKFIIQSSSVKLSVVKKLPSRKQEAEKQTSNGLRPLCQHYDSDEDI